MPFARIHEIEYHLPDRILTNEDLETAIPGVSAKRVLDKTGIAEWRIADEDHCASDLAFMAAEKLFTRADLDKASIDALILCTQTPDHLLPATACLLQDRLGLPTHSACFDLGLRCFVWKTG